MIDIKTTIRKNREVSPFFNLLRFDWKHEWGVPQAGNFLELRIHDGTAPLLRRPFAFSSWNSQTEEGEILYRVCGRSTELLAEKKKGDSIKIMGTLGNTFTIPSTVGTIYAIAGGVGFGPVLFAVQTARTLGKKVVFVAGFRDKEAVLDCSSYNNLGLVITTDDGSMGFSGNPLQYLEEQTISHNAMLLACGPKPLLAACHRFAVQHNIPCEVSMEELMACGLGSCMACVIETDDGSLLRVCKDGPVFESKVLKWT